MKQKKVIEVNRIRSYQTLVNKLGYRSHRKQDYINYIQEIGYQINNIKAINGLYKLQLHFVSRYKTLGDVENISKPINDILQEHGKVTNDKNCVELLVTRSINKDIEKDKIILILEGVDDGKDSPQGDKK